MVNLSEVPGKFLDQRKWKSLRKAASRELIALAYINAPYPDEADPSDFFWDRRGSPEEAVHCYRTGRSLLDECRHLLSVGKLLATGVDKKAGELKAISPREWINIWPMFATDTAVGPNSEYTEIKIYEAPSETIREKLTSDCIRWLKGQRIAGVKLKKASLHLDARREFGDELTDAIFDAAYLASFERRRGRPPKRVANSKI